MIDDVRALRYMEKKTYIPKPYELTTVEVRLPIVNDQIERLVNNLTLNGFMISVPPPRPGPTGQQRASKLEHGYKALWQALERESGENLFHNTIDGAVETGEGIIKLMYRPDRLDLPKRKEKEGDDEYLGRVDEYKRGAKLPIVARTVDRKNFLPVYDEDGLCVVIEMSKRRTLDLFEKFGESSVRSALGTMGVDIDPYSSYDAGREINLIECWTRTHVSYVIAESSIMNERAGMVRSFEHGYGRIPYFVTRSSETSSKDPNKKALSTAFPIRHLVPFLNSTYTMWSNIMFLTAYPTVTEERPAAAIEAQYDEDSDEDPRETVMINPGQILTGPPGTKWDVLKFGPLSQAMTGMVGEMKGIIQGTQLPSMMQGIPPGSRTSGYAIQELTAAAKAKYQTAVSNTEKMLAELLGFAAYLVDKKVQTPLQLLSEQHDNEGTRYLDFYKLDPKDINGYYNVEIKIRPRNPADRVQEGTFMANMYAAGIVSKRAVREEGLGYEQPDEMDDERRVEDWLDSPEISQLILQKAIERSGMTALQDELAAAQQLAQGHMQMMNMLNQSMMGAAGGAGPEGAMPGANGMVGGQASPGVPSVTAPTSPGMEVPGANAGGLPGMGMGQQQPQAQPAMPRQYRGTPGPTRGNAQTQPARPGISGFRSR